MHIGDLMLVTPVLTTLRANFPRAKITLLADMKLRDLVEHNPNLDDCMFMDKKRDSNLFSLWRFIQHVQVRHFDLVINLHRNERASAVAAFSGAKRIVGYSKPFFSFSFNEVMPNRHFIKHQVEAHFDVLRDFVGIKKIVNNGLEMTLTDEMEKAAEEIFAENFPEKSPVIALNIGASWLTKRWPTDYFARVADSLIAEGYHLAFMGGPTDIDLVNECRSQMKNKDSEQLKIFTGQLSLGVLAGFLKRCALFITTDSGPMHVGVAMNVPVVTMFGASPVPGFSPYDSKDILLKTPDKCHPCRIHECPKKTEPLSCMRHITPEKVIDAAHTLLAETGGKPACRLPRPKKNFQCRVVEL